MFLTQPRLNAFHSRPNGWIQFHLQCAHWDFERDPKMSTLLVPFGTTLATLGILLKAGDSTSIDNYRLAGRLRYPGSWSATSRPVSWVDTPGARVRVRLQRSADSPSRDSKPAVAFLLDPPNVVEHYDRHLEKLAREGSSVSAVAAVELPGFGFSFPKKSFGWRFEDYAETARVTLETIFPEADYPAGIVLVAPCAAAYLAIYLASEKSTETRIVKLVLAQAPTFEQERVWAKCMESRTTLLRLPYLKQMANSVGARAMARGWYKAVTGERKIILHLTTIADSALENGACFCLASYAHRTLAANAPTPSLKPVRQPTLFLWGELDRSHRHSTPRSGMEAYAPHAQWHSLSDVGHFPDLEHAERFLELLERFINDAQGDWQMRAKL